MTQQQPKPLDPSNIRQQLRRIATLQEYKNHLSARFYLFDAFLVSTVLGWKKITTSFGKSNCESNTVHWPTKTWAQRIRLLNCAMHYFFFGEVFIVIDANTGWYLPNVRYRLTQNPETGGRNVVWDEIRSEDPSVWLPW